MTWSALTAAATIALWGWTAFWRSPEPSTLRLTVLALGTSTASLIESPDGARLLIDTGPPGLAVARSLDARLAPFDWRLDGLMLTGGGEEALGGLTDLANRYRIGSVWAPVEAQGAAEWLEARPVLSAAGTQLATDVGPVRIALTDGADRAASGLAGMSRAVALGRTRHEPAAPRTRPDRHDQPRPACSGRCACRCHPRVVVLLALPISPPPELAAALAERTVLALDVRGDVTLVLDGGERLWVETER